MVLVTLTTDRSNSRPIRELGEPSSTNTWIYLCGLTDSFDSEKEVENRHSLDQLGKRLNIRFLAIHPFERCEKVNNQLCWPHYTIKQMLETYDKILSEVKDETISGYMGFSNGGYFLNQLAQTKMLHRPIISIGAAGSFNGTLIPNSLTLIVGKLEAIYDSARELFSKAKGSSLSVTLVEHEGEHVLPIKELEEIMKEFQS